MVSFRYSAEWVYDCTTDWEYGVVGEWVRDSVGEWLGDSCNTLDTGLWETVTA